MEGHKVEGCNGRWINVATLTDPRKQMCPKCRGVRRGESIEDPDPAPDPKRQAGLEFMREELEEAQRRDDREPEPWRFIWFWSLSRWWTGVRNPPNVLIHKSGWLTENPTVIVSVNGINGGQSVYVYHDDEIGNAKATLYAQSLAHIVQRRLVDERGENAKQLIWHLMREAAEEEHRLTGVHLVATPGACELLEKTMAQYRLVGYKASVGPDKWFRVFRPDGTEIEVVARKGR
jgi:hypothetical protein